MTLDRNVKIIEFRTIDEVMAFLEVKEKEILSNINSNIYYQGDKFNTIKEIFGLNKQEQLEFIAEESPKNITAVLCDEYGDFEEGLMYERFIVYYKE